MTAPDNPFGESVGKTPALSFKDLPIGTSFTGIVAEPAKLVQSRDFETGEPAEWPDGNPKMAAVLPLVIDGEPRSVWSIYWPKGGDSMFRALRESLVAAGVPAFEEGGRVTITYTGDKANPDKPKLSPAKQYSATYSPPNPFAATDPSTAAGQPWADAGPSTGAMAAKPSGSSEEAAEAARQIELAKARELIASASK